MKKIFIAFATLFVGVILWVQPVQAQTYISPGAGYIAGQLYENSAGTVINVAAADGTKYPWISATAGALTGGMTADVADAGGDNLVVPVAGTYLVVFQVSFNGQNSQELTWQLSEDGTPDAACEFSRTMGAAAAVGAGAGSCLIAMAASGEISMDVASSSGTGDVTVHNASIIAVRVGP